MMAAVLRRRPPRLVVFAFCLVMGLWLEWKHLPGWGLFLFAAAVVAATGDQSD